MLKRSISMILALAMVLCAFTACGASEPPPSEPGSAEPEVQASAPAGEANDVPTGYYNLKDYEALSGKEISEFKEAPMLAEKVKSGALPPLEERLPENPLVLRTLDSVGEYGGTLRMEDKNADRDWNLRHINCANLLERPANKAWDARSTVFNVETQPGILESWSMNEDSTVFTATIRKGLKWSDGVPVTTADVEWRLNEEYLNPDVMPTPPPWMQYLTWGGEHVKFVKIDDNTFELHFAKPYGSYVELDVTAWSAKFYRLMTPSHYLKQYHIKYADEAALLEAMKLDGYSSLDEWSKFYSEKIKLWEHDNVKLDAGKPFPTLDPWVMTEDLGNGNMRLERNPYYYMVDQEGNQLPYIDNLQRTYTPDMQAQNMNIIGGKVDVSCMTLSVQDYPLFKENEEQGNYVTMPLPCWQDQPIIIGFNTEVEDENLRSILGDLRFRQALSVAINRDVINESVFLGTGHPSQIAPRVGSVAYKEELANYYAQYDPALANQLLDEIGMKDIDGDGFREYPNGEPFALKYEYFELSSIFTPVSELVKRFWEEVGIKTDLKMVENSYWWSSLQPNNMNEVTPWEFNGADSNLANPWFFGPSMLVPKWADYKLKGTVSDEEWEEILKHVPQWQQEVQDLAVQLYAEPDAEKRKQIIDEIWVRVNGNLPIIGLVADSLAPMVASKDLGNVQIAMEKEYNYITVMEHGEQFYFTNPERRN